MKRNEAARIARKRARHLMLVELASVSHPANVKPVSRYVKRAIAQRVLSVYRKHIVTLMQGNNKPIMQRGAVMVTTSNCYRAPARLSIKC